MKKITTRKDFLFWATVTSVVAVVIVSLTPLIDLETKNQEARASSVKEATASLKSEIKDISGKRIIGITISEDFSKDKKTDGDNIKDEHTHIKQEIFIDGKAFEFKAQNIPTEIRGGFYDVTGTLDTKTSEVTLTSAKFLGTVFDGVRENTNTSENLGTTKKIPQKKIAVFLVDYQDTATQPFYPSTVNEIMFGNGKFKRYFEEASYGRQSITGDVFGWFTIPQNQGACFVNPETDLAPFIAGNQNINLNNYTNILIITLCGENTSYGMSNTSPQPYTINGTTYNKTVTWVNTSSNVWNQPSFQMMESMEGPHILTNLEHLLIHEFGHALGLYHAHGISCEGTLPEAECQGVAVGNYFDAMAYNTIGLHFSAWAKAKLGWFSGNELRTITESGTYNIRSLESQPPGAGGLTAINSTPKAYKIKPSVNSSKTPIWIEFRNGFGFDAGINTPALGGIYGGGGELPPHNIAENKSGIMIYKEGFESMYSGQINPKNVRLMYLRGAPTLTGENPYQVSLNQGEVYTEPRYGLTVTTLAPISQNARRFQVTLDPNFACTNLPPEISLTNLGSSTLTQNQATFIKVSMKNMDYLSCPNSSFGFEFNFGALQQNGSNNGLIELLSDLAPDDERTFTIGVWVPDGTQPGNYDISVQLGNQASGLWAVENISLTVQ